MILIDWGKNNNGNITTTINSTSLNTTTTKSRSSARVTSDNICGNQSSETYWRFDQFYNHNATDE